MKFVLTIGLALFCIQLTAQFKDYDIARYIVPDHSYKEFSTSFSLGGYMDNESIQKTNKPYKNRIYSSFFEADFRYRYSKYSYNKQISFSTDMSLDPDYHFSKRDNKKKSVWDNETNLNLHYNNRTYYKKENYYSIGLISFNQYYYQKTKATKFEETKNRSINDGLILNIRHGHGRIQNVSNAWIAYRIYENLANNELLNTAKNISGEDIDQLADLITALKSKRFFDFRTYRMDEYRSLYNHLKPNTVGNDIEMFLATYDMYHYARNQGFYNTRLSGSRFSYGLNTNINYSKNYSLSNTYDALKYYGLYVNIEYENYKPLSQKWQRNFWIKAAMGNRNLVKEYDSEIISVQLSLIGNYSIYYYPNTRTTLSSNLKISATSLGYEDRLEDNNFSMNWYNKVYYYLSPQVILQFELSLKSKNYYREVDINNYTKTIQLNFSSGISYSIF